MSERTQSAEDLVKHLRLFATDWITDGGVRLATAIDIIRADRKAIVEAACAAVCLCCAPGACDEKLFQKLFHDDERDGWWHGGHVCRASKIREALRTLLEESK